MKKATIVLLLITIITTAAGSGCIGGGKTKTQTTTLTVTKTVTNEKTVTTRVTTTETTSTYYITTMYTTEFSTVTIPVTTTIVISGTKTSTVVSSNGEKTTLMKFTAVYTYANVPFLVYSISDTLKIVTIPQNISSIIAPVVSFIHESIENKYTSYTPLADYIGDFDLLRLKIMAGNFSSATTPVNFSELYFAHEYDPLHGALYYAAYAMNSHRPVTLLLAVNHTIEDAFMGFNNTYYSRARAMYYDALKYSWFTRYGPYTMVIIVLDENGIITQLNTEKVTKIPDNFTPFQSLIERKHYGLEMLITSGQITKTASYFIDLEDGSGTVWTTIGNGSITTILAYGNNILTMTTIKTTTTGITPKTITITNSYFDPPYYMGVDILRLFPQNNIDYNARVINGLIMYTVYYPVSNTLTIYEFTISSTAIVNATYYEVAIGNDTVASGTIAGWIN